MLSFSFFYKIFVIVTFFIKLINQNKKDLGDFYIHNIYERKSRKNLQKCVK